MKKHKILTAAVLALCIGALPIQALPCSVPVVTANAETETIEYNGMTFEPREERTDELILVSYDGTEENLTIPETVDGKTVTKIANSAFYYNKTIKNVTLPDTIDCFERDAFYFSSLESVNIPKSLRVIPNRTFLGCNKLKSVKFHDDILAISESAFELSSFSLPESLKEKYIDQNINIGSEVFEYDDMFFIFYNYNNDGLMMIAYNKDKENITIPETIDGRKVTRIKEGLFQGNKTIKNLILPDTIYYLETETFADSSLETINIPKSLIIIPDYTFRNCTNLKSVKLHDNVLFMSENAFENASFVPSGINSELTFENSVKYIFEYGNFTAYIYPDTNGNYSFSLLKTKIPKEEALNIVFPETIYGLPVTAFNYPDKDNQGDVFSRNSSVCGYDENDNWYSYSMQPIQYILNMQNDGIGINSVEFPKYLYNINTTAFKDYTELKNIKINAKNVHITNNAFENTGIEELILDNPDVIGNNAFSDCKELKSVIYNECSGDLKIGIKAFANCENLKTITIDGNVGTIEIQNQAFQDCSSLEKIIIPDTCENIKIGRNAFENTNIKQLEINCNCIIDVDAFSGCPPESVIINSDNAEIKLDAFADCENLRELKLSKGCNLSQNAFADCTALENINIDISKSITGSAFNGCENLTSINGEQVFDEKTGDFVPKYKSFIMKNFNLADDIGFINQYVQANAKKIVSENITPDMNDMQKVRTLHDWVCNHTSYSPAGQESHNDAAILMNDTTVCEGYSRMCNLLYHEAGLETYYVTGVNHAWNIVKIDNHYFHVDSTWDDSNDKINYKWFCKSDTEMKESGGNHASWKTAVISSIHDFQENITPECAYSMGDMNTDGNVNIADMVKLDRYILNAEKPDNNLVLSDLNFDGITDVFDVIEMRRKITE